MPAVCYCLTSPTKMTNGADGVRWLTRAPLVMKLSASGINEGDSEDCRSQMTWKIRRGGDRTRTCQRHTCLIRNSNDKLYSNYSLADNDGIKKKKKCYNNFHTCKLKFYPEMILDSDIQKNAWNFPKQSSEYQSHVHIHSTTWK